jgi:glucokinase
MNASSSPARRRSTSAWSSATGGPYNVANVHCVGDRLIGVDVGGTKVAVAVLEDGVLSTPVLRPTALSSSDELVDQLADAIEDAGPADGVGIGVPSVIDFATGSARSSVNIPLQGVPLRQLLTERVGIPAFVDNDATVAALAEAHDDDLNLIAQALVMITVGTGVGGGIVIGGRIYRGVTGAAPELGHILVAADLTNGAPPRAERQPHHASLEYLAAGRALDRLGEARGLGNGVAVVVAARAGHPEARECMRILGERLGVGIANVVNIFDPELVVIGGGVSLAGELLLAPAKESAARFILPGVGTQTRIELARYGPLAGVRGAALLAGQELAREALPLQAETTKES